MSFVLINLGYPGAKVKRKLFEWREQHMQRPRGTEICKQESVLNFIYQKLSCVKKCGNKVGKVNGLSSVEANKVQIYSQGYIHEWRPLSSPLDCPVAAIMPLYSNFFY